MVSVSRRPGVAVLRKPHYVLRPERALRRASQRLSPSADAPCDVRLPWGPLVRVDPREEVGRAIWSTGVYDLAVSETLWRLVDPGDTAADVGADIGYFSGLMARRCSPGGRVVAFEPHPEVFADLTFNVGRWARHGNLAPIELRQLGLSRAAGTLAVHTRDVGRNRGLASFEHTGGRTVQVAVEQLDTQWIAGIDGPAIMKIDADGHELAVVEGAGGVLSGLRDIVFEDVGPQPSQLGEIFRRRGFTVFSVGVGPFGPRLLRVDASTGPPGDAPPSYVATRHPERAIARLRRPGWRVLWYRGLARRRC